MSTDTGLLDPQTLADLTDPTAPGAAETLQWRLRSLQVVNWGGFHGFHELPFHPDATLLSGGSGTGKSTLLDAYTALMMPFSVAFNGASNDSGTGRARNEAGGQRTLLTYLRGKQGVNDETGGARSDNVLRGSGHATWGAVAAVFVDNNGATFSALRVFFVPASAADVPSITARMATIAGTVNLRDLAEPMRHHTAGKPLAHLISGTWPGVKVYSKYSEFSHTLFTRLAIGTNGDGGKALDLLARIQAGRPVNSVNALYRDLVLDTPATFAHADQALTHFDTLADDLARMVEAEAKHTMLRNIRDVQARLLTARDRVAALDQYGLTAPGFTKLTAWSLRKEEDLLDAAGDLAHERHQAADAVRVQARRAMDDLWRDLGSAREDYRTSGGDRLGGLNRDLEALAGDLTLIRTNRERLLDHVAAVSATLTSRGDFDTLQSDARRFAANRETWAVGHQERRDALRDQLRPAEERKQQLQRDLAQLNKSGTRIKDRLGTARDHVAARLNMRPADLPFLAELIDLRPGQERWRNAIETVLGGDASRIVIPVERRREVAHALNDLVVGRQVRLIDGTPGLPHRFPLTGADSSDQAGRVLGKLAFADHPYAGWAQQHLNGPGLNALCVETPDELDGGGFRVTATGQTRSGIRSAIGRNSTDDIIGFSAAEEIERVQADLVAVAGELDDLNRQLAARRDEAQDHERQRDAYAAIATARWADVDVDGLTSRIEALQSEKEQLLGADDRLAKLDERITQLEGEHEAAQLVRAEKVTEAKRLERQWADLTDDKDKVSHVLDPHRWDEDLDLTDAQEADLAAVYDATVRHAGEEDAITEASRFGERAAQMRATLDGQAKAARGEVDAAEKSLTETFTMFRGQWFDANLGETHAAYPDYVRILEELEARGLYETREEWQRTVARWSGEDLLPLSQALSSEISAIKDRVAPINDILATLPFGARRGRLRLKVDDIGSESIRQFRARLRKVTTLATAKMTFVETKNAFEDIAAFMDLLRDPRDPRYNPDRSDRVKLLDVRRHVEVYAVEYPVGTDTWTAREHRQLGTASGGESQELIAFIIGSALRFRLGDELRAWPRFTPVFLDEGFVKADSEFAGRAVSAWRGLGFQIIVGTPEDKFTGLERHMDSFVVVHKDPETGYSFLDHIRDRAAGTTADSAAAPDGAGRATDDAGAGAATGANN